MQYYNFSARVTADQLRKTPYKNQWVHTHAHTKTHAPASLPPPPLPIICNTGAAHCHFILTQQNAAASHKCSQATGFSPLSWSLSLIWRLVAVEELGWRRGWRRGWDWCFRICLRASRAEALCGAADPRWDQRSEIDLDVNLTSWLLLCPHPPTPPLVFAGGAWPPRLSTPTTTPPRMTWSSQLESSRLPSTADRGPSRSQSSESWWKKDTCSAKLCFFHQPAQEILIKTVGKNTIEA